jgi:hypothetical protein
MISSYCTSVNDRDARKTWLDFKADLRKIQNPFNITVRRYINITKNLENAQIHIITKLFSHKELPSFERQFTAKT